MHFESLSDFFAMGGYASYVWGAFGATTVSMLWILFSSLLKRRKLIDEVKRKIAREQRIKEAKNLENTL